MSLWGADLEYVKGQLALFGRVLRQRVAAGDDDTFFGHLF